MDTKLLKQKILDLAIRGKLVPQDPNDEPASVLLERIRKEREELIAQGKLKRTKTKSDNQHYQIPPFEIPTGWALSTLSELFFMHAGKNISANLIANQKDDKKIYPCIGGNGIRGYVENYNSDGAFPIIGRQGALCGNLNFAEGKFYATEHAVIVDTFCGTNVRWAYYSLMQLNLNQYATSTAQPGLSVATIGSVPILVPPINEQNKIETTIENWFSLIDNIEENKDELQESIQQIKSKVLDLAIHGKLVSQDSSDEPASELLKRIAPDAKPCDTSHYANLPSTWVICKLKDIAKVTNGKNQSKVVNPQGKYPLYGSGGIMGYADDFLCKENSTIIGRKGTINNPILVTTKFWNVDTAFGITPKEDIDFKYFYYFCKSFDFKKLDKSTTLPSLTKTNIELIEFPLPPAKEQTKIVLMVDRIFAYIDNIMAEL